MCNNGNEKNRIFWYKFRKCCLSIAGLKFIVENPSISQDDLISGLLELGCNFTLEDVNRQFPEPGLLFPGMTKGNIAGGVSVICNVRDSEFGRAFVDIDS